MICGRNKYSIYKQKKHVTTYNMPRIPNVRSVTCTNINVYGAWCRNLSFNKTHIIKNVS